MGHRYAPSHLRRYSGVLSRGLLTAIIEHPFACRCIQGDSFVSHSWVINASAGERKLHQFPCTPLELRPMQFVASLAQGSRRLRILVDHRYRPRGATFGSLLEASANADAQRCGYDERGHRPIMSRLDTHLGILRDQI